MMKANNNSQLQATPQDMKMALAEAIAGIFPGAEIYTERLPPTKVHFPHWQIIILRVERHESDDRHSLTYFTTVKCRVFDGLRPPPSDLFAQLDHIGHLMLTGLRNIAFNGVAYWLTDAYAEKEPDSDVPLMVLGYYCNIEAEI